MHILIIDDEDGIRRALERQLRMKGHTICWAATGAGGLKLMRTEPVDLVFLDMRLGVGEMTGWDVAREKLMDPAIRGIPVIVLSGLTAQTVRDGAAATTTALSGATMILGKPWETDELFEAIDMMTAKKP